MSKHTPGPWKATYKTVTAPETEDRLPLDVHIHGGNRDDNKANARLIAAAPELLEALKTSKLFFEAMIEEQRCGDMFTAAALTLDKITHVINKATGEHP